MTKTQIRLNQTSRIVRDFRSGRRDLVDALSILVAMGYSEGEARMLCK